MADLDNIQVCLNPCCVHVYREIHQVHKTMIIIKKNYPVVCVCLGVLRQELVNEEVCPECV